MLNILLYRAAQIKSITNDQLYLSDEEKFKEN